MGFDDDGARRERAIGTSDGTGQNGHRLVVVFIATVEKGKIRRGIVEESAG